MPLIFFLNKINLNKTTKHSLLFDISVKQRNALVENK